MLNQPRYVDNNNGGANRRSVHGTGRSNYGGGGGRGSARRGIGNAATFGSGNNTTNDNNPISNWIQSARQRRRNQKQQQQQQQQQRGRSTVVVGTEANAMKQMTRNAKNFQYPTSGFVTPIEHSLLYAMIQYPERYPESVVKGEINDEEFEQYLYVKDETIKMTTTTRGGGSGSGRRGGWAGEDDKCDRNRKEEDDEEGGDHAVETTDNDDDDDRRVSYAQLSALLALSAEKNPSTATPSGGTSSNGGNNGGGGDNSNKKDEELSIGQALCRKLLRTITRYSDAHSLDRSTEIAEFLNPVERRCRARNERAALRTLLPAYAGYTVSLLTGNPLPLLIGVAALSVEDTMVEETANVSGFSAAGSRTSQLETTGLLDECDSD